MTALKATDVINVVPPVLSVGVVGALLDISYPTVYRLMKSGSLLVLPLPGHPRVLTAKLEEMLHTTITPDMYAAACHKAASAVGKAQERSARAHEAIARKKAAANG